MDGWMDGQIRFNGLMDVWMKGLIGGYTLYTGEQMHG